MADEPAWSESARGAWGYLLGEREAAEDECPLDSDGMESGEYSDTVLTLRYLAGEDHMPGNPHDHWPTDADGCGAVRGSTPGYDGDHDLGVAYSVTRVDHSDVEHVAGRLTGCPACEARCYCEDLRAEYGECTYRGEHA
jgi:hypothetical protein